MSRERSVRLALIQRKIASTREETVAAAVRGIEEARDGGAELICLQELFCDPYFCQTEDPAHFELAEASDGPTVQALREAAKRTQTTVMVPYFERRAPGLFHNSAVILGPDGSTLGHYRKMHIPDDPSFMEKYYFTPGDLGFQCVETPACKVGPLICWDQWYPEAARHTALLGAEVLLYPTAIGWLKSEKESEGAAQLDAWKTIQRSHAIANGLFVAAVNRVGHEGDPETGIEFWGHSMVVDPMGRILAEAGEEEATLLCDLDLSLLENTRKWWPFFRDRRIDAYQGLTQRWLGR